MRIEKGDAMVQMLSASALRHGTVENDAKIQEFSTELMKNPTPENCYHMAQLVKFAVNDALNERTGYFDAIAEYKNIGDNDDALFDVDYDTSFAVIQATNASTPRFESASKTVGVDTMEVASRFRVSMYDLRSGKADIGKLTARATARMEEQMVATILEVLNGGYGNTINQSPFYGTGSGIVPATLDPMVRYFQRYGATALIGDIEIMDKLANSVRAASDDMINEYYRTGVLGYYKGAKAVQMLNGYLPDGKTPVMSTKKLFIVPNGHESPLKILKKGDVLAMSAEVLDTGHYEVALRQRFGAALVYGNVPMLGVYNDDAA